MRMMRRVHSEERGAVMMIVAISLIVLLGMLVLTVDLGSMVSVRREMVRAADAAALAAAQECAMGPSGPFGGDPMQAATQIAATNHAGASVSSLTFDQPGECDSPTIAGAKLVTVKLTTSVDMFFAPIFGVSSGTVTAQATATWESPGTVPIAIFLGPLEACKALWTDPTVTECTIEYPMDALGQPRWGVLGLTQDLWGKDADCSLSADWANSIINGGGIWPLPTPPPPQWDCIDNGVQSSTWSLLPPNTFWFPVVDLDLSKGHVVPGGGGEPCTGADIPTLQLQNKDCQITRAWVIDFVKLKVLSSDPGNPPTITVVRVPSTGSRAGVEIRLVN